MLETFEVLPQIAPTPRAKNFKSLNTWRGPPRAKAPGYKMEGLLAWVLAPLGLSFCSQVVYGLAGLVSFHGGETAVCHSNHAKIHEFKRAKPESKLPLDAVSRWLKSRPVLGVPK